ncbi:uncharacterized protein LOC126717796 isoform X1 [Quercus robur]|uniref:Uncharacterized protein n=1 Tax=Quercus lobata TaxID=97700 RepID=A0A7N2L919_QUELO|nr:uncharacterized protein LOC115981921 isoform X1 [Quercus lobata]XP_050275656.1 uncharacterized protein LOC126717796 isoform X1 [Quercus robur]
MNISMGFSCEGDYDANESEVPLIDESRDARYRVGMDWHHLEVEVDMDFWPVEHPMEPPDEDRPVKCPMPDSTVINCEKRISYEQEGGVNEKRIGESLRKRAEATVPAAVNRQRVVAVDAEPPVRAVRKRHHTLTRGDYIMTPTMRTPSLPPLPNQNITIFQMLQQFDKFESE